MKVKNIWVVEHSGFIFHRQEHAKIPHIKTIKTWLKDSNHIDIERRSGEI